MKSLRGKDAQVADVPDIDDFEPLLDQLEARKTAVEVAKKELAAQESTPRDPSEGLAALKRQIAKLVEDGKPKFGDLFHPDDFDFHGRFKPGKVGRARFNQTGIAGGAGGSVIDAVALVAWLFPDAFEKRLTEAAQHAAPENGVSREEKIKRVEEARAKLADALRAEHAVIVALERQGQFQHRRRDYHPAVLLGIEAPPRVICEY